MTLTSRLRRSFVILGFVALGLGLAPALALAQSGPPGKAQAQTAKPAAGDAGKDAQKQIDEIAEAGRVLAGPAGHPECVWLGRRVVVLMWRDDLDTAFRHLDLYDRFGCPSAHIQAAFRCLIKQGPIDPKAQQTLIGRVHDCWLNPSLVAQPAAAKAAPQAPASTQPTKH